MEDIAAPPSKFPTYVYYVNFFPETGEPPVLGNRVLLIANLENNIPLMGSATIVGFAPRAHSNFYIAFAEVDSKFHPSVFSPVRPILPLPGPFYDDKSCPRFAKDVVPVIFPYDLGTLDVDLPLDAEDTVELRPFSIVSVSHRNHPFACVAHLSCSSYHPTVVREWLIEEVALELPVGRALPAPYPLPEYAQVTDDLFLEADGVENIGVFMPKIGYE